MSRCIIIYVIPPPPPPPPPFFNGLHRKSMINALFSYIIIYNNNMYMASVLCVKFFGFSSATIKDDMSRMPRIHEIILL